MAGAKEDIHKYMVLQRSKLFYYKVSGEFLRQDLQSSNSFGMIQNLGSPELSEEKIQCFIGERSHIHLYTYIYIYIYIYVCIYRVITG